MDNFDLRKYLAENKLNKENEESSDKLTDDEVSSNPYQFSDYLERKYDNLEEIGIWKNDLDGTMTIEILKTYEPGEGTGSEVMKEVIKWADSNKFTLTLTPDTSFGMGMSELKSFYKKFGFKDNTNRKFKGGTMYRLPK